MVSDFISHDENRQIVKFSLLHCDKCISKSHLLVIFRLLMLSANRGGHHITISADWLNGYIRNYVKSGMVYTALWNEKWSFPLVIMWLILRFWVKQYRVKQRVPGMDLMLLSWTVGHWRILCFGNNLFKYMNSSQRPHDWLPSQCWHIQILLVYTNKKKDAIGIKKCIHTTCIN